MKITKKAKTVIQSSEDVKADEVIEEIIEPVDDLAILEEPIIEPELAIPTRIDDACEHVQSAIDLLAEEINSDIPVCDVELAKEAIANLSVVILEIK